VDARKRELIERLGRLGGRMSALMRGTGEDWAESELTMPQLRALSLLNEAPQRMSDVAAHLGSSLSSATSLIERLEGKGLVERVHDPVDRRVVMCHLTASGRAEVERFWQIKRSRLEAVADVLTPEELATVVDALEVLSAALERHSRRRGATTAGDQPPSTVTAARQR
jgi:DNA-binding MarR family transcriptional regulator